MEYKFKGDSIFQVIIHLLLEIQSSQQAAIQLLTEHLNISDEEKDKFISDLNALAPSLKEETLKELYISFGDTPAI